MVLLDYPNKTNPNKVYLMQGDEILYESVYQEEGVETPNFVDAYLAYSPAGEATGKKFKIINLKSNPNYKFCLYHRSTCLCKLWKQRGF